MYFPRYECTQQTGSRGGQVTVRTVFTCCPGFRYSPSLVTALFLSSDFMFCEQQSFLTTVPPRLVERKRCEEVGEMAPLVETLESLGGANFLDLVLQVISKEVFKEPYSSGKPHLSAE